MHLARGNFLHGARVRPWAFAIAINLSKDDEKKRRRYGAVFDDREMPTDPGEGATPTAFDLAHARELERKLSMELDCLSEKERVAFELIQIEGLSQQEVAEAVGTTVASVKSSSHRAYEALRKAFTEFLRVPR
jgi:RNA polymerase sigma-70 factor (ECF subfamily)